MSDMRDPVVPAELNGYEVLQRVRRARDWARSEAEDESDPTEAPSFEHTAYRVIADVLDEILDPGSHTEP